MSAMELAGVHGVRSSLGAESTSGAQESGRDPRLEQAVHEFHAVFFQQLFKALRDTVPEGSGPGTGSDYGFFMDLMDEELSEALAARMDRGLGSALYRALVELQGSNEAVEASITNEGAR